MNRLFESIFGGTSDLCDDTSVKCTYWRELDDGDDASCDKKELVRAIDLFGCTPLRSIHLGSYPNLRRVTVHGQNGLDERVPSRVEVVSLVSPSFRGLGGHDASVDGFFARAIFDQFYRENIVSFDIDNISGDSDADYATHRLDHYGYIEDHLDLRGIGVNRHDLTLRSRFDSFDMNKCIGAVSFVEPLAVFRTTEFWKDFSLSSGYGAFKCGEMASVSAGYNSSREAVLRKVKNSKPFLSFYQQYEGENSCLASVLPIFVEQSVIDSDTPFGFSHNLVCIEDKPLWDIALVLARQYFAKEELRSTNPNVQSFIESCGISVNRIPDSKNTNTRAYLLARQIYKSPFVRDMLDDAGLLLDEYVKARRYVEKGKFDSSNPWGLSQRTFDELLEEVNKDKPDVVFPELYRQVLERTAPRMKTVNVWRQHRYVYEALEAQTLYELGDSYFRVDGYFQVKYSNEYFTVDVGELLDAANRRNPA
ncbi:MAG: hypothetical protein LBR89_02290 [Holosporales bacterium]|nr:hypothetical protein [Holosporales bacterium]